MRSPSLQQGIDHRSGIPGVFGVGDITHYLGGSRQEAIALGRGTSGDTSIANNNGLVSAEPIGDASDQKIVTATPYEKIQEREKAPVADRKCWLIAAAICLVIVGTSVGVVCGSGISSGSGEEGETTTSAPSLSIKQIRQLEFQLQLEQLFRERIFPATQQSDFVGDSQQGLGLDGFEGSLAS